MDFERIGERLFTEHLVGGNFGNMSVRVDSSSYYITKTGSYLDADPAQIVLMPLNGRQTPGASSEWRVHTAVYNTSEHQAIVHAHPPFSVVMSLLEDEILPIDSEGQLLAQRMEVVDGACGSQVLADNVADALKYANIVIARGHGTFAAGRNLDEAYLYTSLAEHCCKVLWLKSVYRK